MRRREEALEKRLNELEARKRLNIEKKVALDIRKRKVQVDIEAE